MNIRRMVLATALATALVVGVPTRPVRARERNCVSGPWPALVHGFPDKLLDADDTGAFVWTDADGWHLRVTHAGTKRMVFRGSVETTRELLSVSRAAGSNREVRFTKDRTQTRFDLVSYGSVDGLDFQVGCSSGFLLRLTLDNLPLTAAQVFLGETAAHPPSMPTRIER